MRASVLVILLLLNTGSSVGAWEKYTDFSAVMYLKNRLLILSNDEDNSGRYFVAKDVIDGDLEPNQNYLLPDSLISTKIEIDVSCSPKNDLESFESVNGELYFLQEQCAKLYMPNGLFLDYSSVEFHGHQVGEYRDNKRLEGLSIIRNDRAGVYRIAVSVEAGTREPDKPPFLIIHDVPNLPLAQEQIDHLDSFISVEFPVKEIHEEFGIRENAEEDGCYMRITELEWGDERTLYSLISFNPSRCYRYSFLCEHEMINDGGYEIGGTQCIDLAGKMSSVNAGRNWEGMDKISRNKFILVADSEHHGEFQESVFVLEVDD